ncbi:hypothetical protein AR505_1255 [methanogenic archaeon ISO4-H5]|nr:hypothetical protein AR505_1255 [methanogenic archaeon ISO4-H5]
MQTATAVPSQAPVQRGPPQIKRTEPVTQKFEVERTGPDTIRSPSFTDNRYFVHISPGYKLLVIRPNEDGKVKISNSLAPINEFMKTVFPEYDFSEEIKPYSFKKPCNFDENYYVMLVDRDQKSFGKKNVEEVRSDCSKLGYKLILTSPYFELWLTLHFEKYEKEKLLEFVKEEVQLIYEQGIPRSNIGRSLGPKRYMELLKPGYTKNGTFEWVKRSDINRALANSEDLCTNLDMLVQELHSNDLSSVGTNIKELFDLLKE